MRSALELIFTLEGTAVLEEDGEMVWTSDDDEDFQEEIGNVVLKEEDATTVLEYLQETDHITGQEAVDLEISVEDSEELSDSDDTIEAEFVDIPDPAKNTRTQ